MFCRIQIWCLMGLFLLFCLGCSDKLLDETLTGPSGEPAVTALGLRLVPSEIQLDLTDLSQAEQDQVALGSYLVNGVAGCGGCHTSEAGYLAGGVEFPVFFLPPDVQGYSTLYSRNLTPDPDTGLHLTEAEFIEAMQTGIDHHDSEGGQASRMIYMPVQIYRFMLVKDLKAIYAYLRHIPAVHNEVRESYVPPFPFPPVPVPPLSGESSDPNGIERGLMIPHVFSSGADADAFATQFDATVGGLSAADRAKVGRGSYLVNTLADCSNCHTDGVPDGTFDSGLLPGTLDVNTATYLAGGVDMGALFQLPFPVVSRNLTFDVTTGLQITEAQFIHVMRYGADFRRPTGSLRVTPHFPAEFRMTLDDLQAIYAYLKSIPSVQNNIVVSP